MARSTTNKSMRVKRPVKVMRRTAIDLGETDDANRVAGASGSASGERRRPGRAASLRSSASRTRSQSWRSPAKGARTMRRGNLAKGSRTGGRK
jgi:hypothetical protein